MVWPSSQSSSPSACSATLRAEGPGGVVAVPPDRLPAWACRTRYTGTVVPYSPLGRGFLTGKIQNVDALDENDYRKTVPRFQGDNFQRNLDLVKRVEEIAQESGARPPSWRLPGSWRRDSHRSDPRHKTPQVSSGERRRR